ncbi:MAG: glycoside hydrolase family 78 protein [Bacteroidales bacterium]|nr:glycoside hydrolase family 78 protein [Bacteroidales bacterium]
MIKKVVTSFTVLLVVIWTTGLILNPASLEVSHTTCEDLTNPLGLDDLHPRLSWQLTGEGRGILQTAYEIRAAASPEQLLMTSKLIWSSGKVDRNQSVYVPYDGPALSSGQRVYWQVRVWDNRGHRSAWSKPAWWEMGLLLREDWIASWIESLVPEDTMKSTPAQMFRHAFTVTKKVRTARAYVSAHGLYEMYLNGSKVGDQLFTPGWTSYHKRLQYQVYDVTDLLRKGDNVAGALVGDGWYRGHLAFRGNRHVYGSKLALLMQIVVEYTDGTKEIIGTDESWKSSTGPVRMSDIYNGETYDARLENPAWKTPDFDDNTWEGVNVKDYPKDILVASEGLPVKRIEEVRAVKLFVTPAGDTVVDMGQNMVGWIRLKVQGPAGTKVVLRHAEVLDKNGNFYTANLRAAKQTDTYILKGKGEEVFEPHFTFHGFRYVAVQGYPGKLTADKLTGIVIHSAFERTGVFSCSDALVNQLQHNIQWGMKGNFLDVPTDCPQRDERLGWTGDAQVFAPTACFNGNVAAFYRKWMKDFTADQQQQGQIPHVIPDVLSRHGQGASAAAGWADAAVIVPWTVYVNYGDKKILKNQYESMKRWVDYQAARAGNTYFWNTDFTYGDWLSYHSDASDYPGAYTDKDFLEQVYFARSALLMTKTAEVLGKKEDATHYRALFEKIKKVFRDEFITPEGRLSPNTQTAYVQALSLGLIPQDLEKKAAHRLAGNVEFFGHLTTGFLGAFLLCPVLSDYGYTDLAYRLLKRKKYPSWLYPVTKGATTIWERWDGIKPDGTFQNPGMNSFNHYAYGAIGEWMYRYMAGLNPDEQYPGYKHIIIHPRPGGGFSFASASLMTHYGKVSTYWSRNVSGGFTVDVEIPCNTTATVVLPGAAGKNVILDGRPVERTVSSDKIRKENGNMILELGSGVYGFEYE